MIFNLGTRMCEGDDDGNRSLIALPGIAIKACGALGWLTGQALKAAVSRQREYLADARAVQFTRSKDGLGGVLRKVAGEESSELGVGSSDWHPSVQHMLLVDTDRTDHWFDSHPPLAERIRRIYGRPMTAISARAFAPTQPTYYF